jgi:hypothetical protein
MQKSQYPDSHVRVIRRDNAHSVNFRFMILAMIERYESDSISSSGKIPADECLLNLRATDASIPWIICQCSEIVERDETNAWFMIWLRRHCHAITVCIDIVTGNALRV